MEMLPAWQYPVGLVLSNLNKPNQPKGSSVLRPQGWGMITRRSQNPVTPMDAYHQHTGCSCPGCSGPVWWHCLSWCSAPGKAFLCQTWPGWHCPCSCTQRPLLCNPCAFQTWGQMSHMFFGTLFSWQNFPRGVFRADTKPSVPTGSCILHQALQNWGDVI